MPPAVSAVSDAVREALAPTGTLRAAINMGNFLLVTGTDPAGEPTGVSPDMARAVADRIGVELELKPYPSPAAIADSAEVDEWDIANIGAEPARAAVISFTAAYCEIQASYLIGPDSPISSIAEVDRPGVRIASAARTAYGLWLDRNIEHAEIVNAQGLDGSYDTFVDGGLDALAGLTPRLIAEAERLPGSRILPGSFTAVQQAVGTPVGRDPSAIAFLQAFVEEAKTSGLVAAAIDRHGVVGLSVAPPTG